jgi:hypothetical protein
MSQRFYSDEEAEAILLTASQKSQVGVSRENLLRTAAELGITPEEVDAAEQVLKVQKEEQEDTTLRKAFGRHMAREFYEHLTAYVIVNSFLVLLDFATIEWTRLHWCFFPIIGWGIGIAFSFFEAFNRNGSAYEKAYLKWMKKQKRKAMPSLEQAAELADEWLKDHPGDAEGAEQHVRSQLDIRKRIARVVVEQELSR